ncbi:hypothetical protein CHGG_00139 [Chaetomium globosum CBS 148.51]|uniref:HAT C-terminal dimerisation domain-containing protein n=1 Tax=Chaetomium globosum (strain ATCC 6205 / CBS 148.51 / DSM 1962 / NBRC 6347 / NRRL 1970) TaxID=306901 RepID=Q2HI15_CHAGB|nr:uncharacterized protein CHGG_00139 [Chaetomium globosum CBS 148.51]EAQ91904.1 hypothetical protein CHGG_00139 [Chaetomium globosum CBS 148.51]
MATSLVGHMSLSLLTAPAYIPYPEPALPEEVNGFTDALRIFATKGRVVNRRAGLSPEALAELGDVVNERDPKFVQLVADNDTRWNSVYLMIERALRLRFQIDWFCQWSLEEKDAKRRLPSEDRLDTEDWVLLTNIKAILEPVHRITRTFEGHAPRFGERYIAITVALQSFAIAGERPQRQTVLPRRYDGQVKVNLPGHRRGAIRPPDVSFDRPIPPAEQQSTFELTDVGLTLLRKSLDFAIAKLQQYITLMEDVPVYWSAMILLPSYRTRWIERFLAHDRATAIIARFKQQYQEEYEGIGGTQPTPTEEPHEQPRRPYQDRLVGHDFYYPKPDPADIDEVAIYLAEPVRPAPDALAWWIGNQARFPRLSLMAFDLLSIPVMSSECERVFSSARLTVGLNRYNLSDNSINMVESLKQWLKRGQEGCIYPAIHVEVKHEGVGVEKVESSNAGNLAKRLPLATAEDPPAKVNDQTGIRTQNLYHVPKDRKVTRYHCAIQPVDLWFAGDALVMLWRTGVTVPAARGHAKGACRNLPAAAGEENGFQLVIPRGPVERGVVGTVLGRMGVVLFKSRTPKRRPLHAIQDPLGNGLTAVRIQPANDFHGCCSTGKMRRTWQTWIPL